MPRIPKIIRRPVGNPLKPIDWNIVEAKVIGGSNGVQIAGAIGIHPDTLYQRCELKFGMNWSAYFMQKRAKGEDALHQSQFKKALNGNPTMLIWLGKQRLGQKETQEQTYDEAAYSHFAALMKQFAESQSKAIQDLKIEDINIKDETKS